MILRVGSGEFLGRVILSARCGRLSSYSCRQVSIRSLASCSDSNQWALRHSRRSVALNDSTWALSVGFPDLEKSIRTLC